MLINVSQYGLEEYMPNAQCNCCSNYTCSTTKRYVPVIPHRTWHWQQQGFVQPLTAVAVLTVWFLGPTKSTSPKWLLKGVGGPVESATAITPCMYHYHTVHRSTSRKSLQHCDNYNKSFPKITWEECVAIPTDYNGTPNIYPQNCPFAFDDSNPI